MARIAGVDLPDNAKADWALTRIKGIGWTRANEVMMEAAVSSTKRVKDLSTEDLSAINSALEKFATEGDLIRQIRENIQRLRETSSYRGIRHTRGLPARGQRTRSNARTKRGKRKTVGSFRKDALTKTSSSDAS